MRTVGSLRLSVLGFGVGQITPDTAQQTRPLVQAAIDAGITYFDVSNRPPSTEQEIGNMLRPYQGNVVIGTKFGSRPRPGELACAAPDYARSCAEASLRNLRTETIDLFILHRPDPATPIADTLGALHAMVREGKIREVACSKFSAAQLTEAAEAGMGSGRFAAVENHCSLMDADDVRTVLPVCSAYDIAYLAYWPLAAGLLTGKYRLDKPMPGGTRFTRSPRWMARKDSWHSPARLRTVEQLLAWAEARGHTLLELAFAWLLTHRQISTAIAGASSPGQVRANAAAAAAWRLTEAERDEVSAIAQSAG